jgi:hypothetical protein
MDDTSHPQTQAISISVIILADKDQPTLHHALQSVDWAAERLLIWTGDKEVPQLDDDVKIVKIPGKVGDFAQLRNEAIKHAQYSWVFFLDSDEIVRRGSEKELLHLTQQDEFVGARILRRDYFLGKELKHGEVGNVRLLRIYNKNCGQYFRPVHEVLKLDGKVQNLGLVIDHYAHQSISSFLEKIIRYTMIEAKLRQKQSLFSSYLQIVFYPPAKFVWNYVLNLGMLDGWRGLIYAMMMSIHSFAVRALLIEKNYAQHTP